MSFWTFRLRHAVKASCIHLSLSLVVAGLAAVLVFGLWYPYPYRELAGGRELFLLVIAVDVVCGPLLTLVIFNPKKRIAELLRDLTLVSLIQILALSYGIYSVWLARPLFLVQEIDRFKVIAAPDVNSADLEGLTVNFRPKFWRGVLVVAIRPPNDETEREKVMRDSIQGGRDYAERPEFYLPYEGTNAVKSLNRAKALTAFLKRWPGQQAAANKLALEKKLDLSKSMYLPVTGRQDWIAVLDKQGQIQGFLKGDGF